MQPRTLGLALQGSIDLRGALKLLVVLGAVESVGAVTLGAQSCMPAEICYLTGISPLIERLEAGIVGIESSRLGAVIAVGAGVVNG